MALSREEAQRLLAMLEQSAPEQEQEPAGFTDYIRSGLQGASLGFGDEATAALAAAGASLAGYAPSFGEAYTDIRDMERQKQSEFATANPGTDLALQLAGGVLTGGAGGARAAGTQLGQRVMNMGTIPRVAAIGATAGGLEGLGRSEGDIGQQAFGTGVGGLAGAAGGLALEPITRLAAGVGGAAKRRFFEGPEKQAQRIVRRSLGDEIPIDDVTAEMNRLGEGSLPADIDSLDGLGLLASATPAGRAAAEQVKARRLRGQHASALDVVNRVGSDVGMTPTTLRQKLNRISDQQRAAAKPMYERAYARENPANPELLKLMNRPSVRRAFIKARDIARDEGDDDLDMVNMFAKDDDGKWVFSNDPEEWTTTPIPTWKEWDYIQRGLRGLADTDVTNRDAVRRYTGLRRELLSELDPLNPDWQQARRTYAGYEALKDAAEKGAKALGGTVDLEDTRELWKDLSPSERQVFLTGVFKDIRKKVANIRENANIENNALFNTPGVRDKLKLFFGRQGDVLIDELLEDIRRTGSLVRKARRRSDRTVTYDLGAARSQAEEAAGGSVLSDLASGGVGGALQGAARRATGSSNPMNDPVLQQQLSDIMFDRRAFEEFMRNAPLTNASPLSNPLWGAALPGAGGALGAFGSSQLFSNDR